MLIVFLVFVLGLVVGSFLNVVILRTPQSQSILGRSRCTYCHRQLIWVDLIPVLSFIWLQGRCRGCRRPISPRYATVELVTACAFALGAFVIAPVSAAGWLMWLLWVVVVCVGIVTFVVDLEHFIILDVITFCGLVASIVIVVLLDVVQGQSLLAWSSSAVSGFLGAAIGTAPLLLLWGMSRGRWIGFGDVKFMVFVGMTLGFPAVIVGMLLAFWLGAGVGLLLLALGIKGLKDRLPFGTFLVLGQMAAFLWGQQILQWYMHLFML